VAKNRAPVNIQRGFSVDEVHFSENPFNLTSKTYKEACRKSWIREFGRVIFLIPKPVFLTQYRCSLDIKPTLNAELIKVQVL